MEGKQNLARIDLVDIVFLERVTFDMAGGVDQASMLRFT